MLGVPYRVADLLTLKHVDVSKGLRDAVTFGGNYNWNLGNERGGRRKPNKRIDDMGQMCNNCLFI